jgi:hypothetical protein
VHHVKSKVGIQVDILFDGGFGPPFGLLHNIAPLVNKCRNPRVSRLGYPPACFDGAQFGIIQVLIFARCVFPPAIVGNNGYKLRPLFYRACNISPKNRFITNNRIDTDTALRIKNIGIRLAAIGPGCAPKVLKNRL